MKPRIFLFFIYLHKHSGNFPDNSKESIIQKKIYLSLDKLWKKYKLNVKY